MKKILFFVIALSLSLTAVKSQPSINDPFFDQVNYIGAFGSINWTAGWCNWDPQNTTYPVANIVVPAGSITTNTTWTSSNTYLLDGWVYVKNGATLTIEPGTVIRGDYANKGTLIIERGSKIIAQGTASQPIVFTSNEAVGNRDYGDWGGIILCGKASINQSGDTAQIEGGPTSFYGGGSNPDDNDNSGVLTYIRIEFAGVPFVVDKEINGLTMGGVGKATTINHIQTSFCGDDAFEWFGGTVNCKYLVSYRNWDDDFDTDNGYRGLVQFAVALRDPNIADPQSKSNGFESDNDNSGSTNTPQTSAVFSNISMFGPKATFSTTINSNFKAAMHLRRNTALNIYNSVFAGYKDGLLLDGALCETNANSSLLKIKHCFIAGTSGSEFLLASGSVFDINNWFFNTMECNDTLMYNTELMITDPFNLSNPNFLPMTGSPLLNRTWLDCTSSVSENQISDSKIQVYPNPASAATTIELNLSESEFINIEIFDVTGRSLMLVHNDEMPQGINKVIINSSNFSSGVVLIKISGEKSTVTKRLLINN